MRFYFGWAVIAMTMISNMLVLGATTSSFGLYVIPVSQELGLSRATMNTGFAIISIGSAAVAPIIGRLVDRTSVRLVMSTCAVLLGLGFVILGLSSSLWLAVLALGLMIPLGLDGGVIITLVVLEARWFRHHRARAMALSAIGISLGGVVVTPVTAILISQFGWRMTLIMTGCTLMAILLGFASLVRERPGPRDIEPGTDSVANNGDMSEHVRTAPNEPLRFSDLLRSRLFWVLAIGPGIAFGANAAITISLVPMMTDKGLTLLESTSLVSVSALAGVAAKLAISAFGDRARRDVLMALLVLLGACVNVSLLFADGYMLLVGCAALFGMGAGALLPLFQALLADRFGVASLGTARGLTTPIVAVSNVACIRFAGEVYDRTGSYDGMFMTFAVIMLLSAAMILGMTKTSLMPWQPKGVTKV